MNGRKVKCLKGCLCGCGLREGIVYTIENYHEVHKYFYLKEIEEINGNKGTKFSLKDTSKKYKLKLIEKEQLELFEGF